MTLDRPFLFPQGSSLGFAFALLLLNVLTGSAFAQSFTGHVTHYRDGETIRIPDSLT